MAAAVEELLCFKTLTQRRSKVAAAHVAADPESLRLRFQGQGFFLNHHTPFAAGRFFSEGFDTWARCSALAEFWAFEFKTCDIPQAGITPAAVRLGAAAACGG